MSSRSWPIAILALFGAALTFFLFAAVPWMAQSCDASRIDAGKPLLAGAGGCVEFWLNRYQAFISAIIAGVIAFWAGRLLLRQTRATEKQVAAQRYDFLRDRISETRRLSSACHSLYTICNFDLHPSQNVRRSGASPWGLVGLMTKAEIPIEKYRTAIQHGYDEISDMAGLEIKSNISAESSDKNGRFLAAAALYMHACEEDLLGPAVNLGLGQQGSPPEVTKRSERSQTAFTRVYDAYQEAMAALDNDATDLTARLEAAKAIAL